MDTVIQRGYFEGVFDRKLVRVWNPVRRTGFRLNARKVWNIRIELIVLIT